jgi:hypothetical protein
VDIAALRPNIVKRRAGAQRISCPLGDPAAVVAWLGAVQAQDYASALWAVGLRTVGARQEDVEQAILDRRIVRTWPMRGTLHFVAAPDARWMTELLAHRASGAQTRLRSLGIDESVLTRSRRALARHLQGGHRLTRAAACDVLEHATLATSDQHRHILWRLAIDRFICCGPHEGKQQTFVLFDEWVPKAPRLPREEALAELAVRYFTGHGPATVRDFTWWSGLTLADARLAVTLAGTRIESETINGTMFWFAERPIPETAAVDPAYALPAFDELLIGYADRSAALTPVTARRAIAGGTFKPVVLAGGHVLGTWKRRVHPRELACDIEPFARLTKGAAKASTSAFERYARFVGRRLRGSGAPRQGPRRKVRGVRG